MKTKKGLKVFLIVFSLFLFTILATTGAVYAYWIGSVNNPNNEEGSVQLEVGKGTDINDANLTITSVATTDTTKKLVPTGKAALSNGGTGLNVEKYEFDVTIKLNSDNYPTASGVSKAIKLTVKGKTFANDATHAGLVNVEIKAAGTTNNFTDIEINNPTGKVYKVVVTLSEPSTKAIYDAIINKQLKVLLEASINS